MSTGINWLLNTFGSKKAVNVNNAFADVFNINNQNVQLVLQDLSIYCNFNGSSFNKDSAYITAFNEGARDVLLHILELSSIKPTSLLALQHQLKDNNY